MYELISDEAGPLWANTTPPPLPSLHFAKVYSCSLTWVWCSWDGGCDGVWCSGCGRCECCCQTWVLRSDEMWNARCWVVRLLYILEWGRKRNEPSQVVIILQSHRSSCTADTTASAWFLAGAHCSECLLAEAFGVWIGYFQCTNVVFSYGDQMLKTLALTLVHFTLHFRNVYSVSYNGPRPCMYSFRISFSCTAHKLFQPVPTPMHISRSRFFFTTLELVLFQPLPSPMHVSKPHLFFMHLARSFPNRSDTRGCF